MQCNCDQTITNTSKSNCGNVPIPNHSFSEETTLLHVNYKPQSPLSLLCLFALEMKITVVHTVLIRRNSSATLTYPSLQVIRTIWNCQCKKGTLLFGNPRYAVSSFFSNSAYKYNYSKYFQQDSDNSTLYLNHYQLPQ